MGLSLLAVAYLVLRGQDARIALLVTGGLGSLTAAALALNATEVLAGVTPWLVGAVAVGVVFGLARHILFMAAQSLRRGILNQHVLLEFGAFAGLVGGLIGLIAGSPGFRRRRSSRCRC